VAFKYHGIRNFSDQLTGRIHAQLAKLYFLDAGGISIVSSFVFPGDASLSK
jgi:hypothetical protein